LRVGPITLSLGEGRCMWSVDCDEKCEGRAQTAPKRLRDEVVAKRIAQKRSTKAF
jgi:hypothetical protein